MPSKATESQRDLMRKLYRHHNGDETAVCSAYVKAEGEGFIFRTTGDLKMPPEIYARELWRDGIAKGWLVLNVSGSV